MLSISSIEHIATIATMSGRLTLREHALNFVFCVAFRLQPLIEAWNLVVDPAHPIWDNFDTVSDHNLPLCKLALGQQTDAKSSVSVNTDCSICWSDIEESDLSLRHTLCNTVWHEACLQAHVDHVRSDVAICPLCRHSLVDDVQDFKRWKCTWRSGPIKRLTNRGYASCLAVLLLFVVANIVFGLGGQGEFSKWQSVVLRWLRIVVMVRAKRLGLLELHNEFFRDIGRPKWLVQMLITHGLFVVLSTIHPSIGWLSATTSSGWPAVLLDLSDIVDLYVNMLAHGCWSIGWLGGPQDM